MASRTITNLVTINAVVASSSEGSLILDARGDLFGTTDAGGANSDGSVFEIANTATGYAASPTTLVSFNGTNGKTPLGNLIADTNGDLFGTTSGGGASSDGTVFEIVNTATGYATAPTTLVNFSSSNGTAPDSLFMDANGNLLGTTSGGGANGKGTVFEVAKTGVSYASSPTTLVSFNGTNGATPDGGLIADIAGDLFGTTSGGGANSKGTVFEIANTATGYATSPNTLVSFNGTNGVTPLGSLTTDTAGDLFGTTSGGGANGYGTVFEIANTSTGYASSPVTLVSFGDYNGANPVGSLIIDASGNLFGTTTSGFYPDGFGGGFLFSTAFEIANTATGYASAPISIAGFGEAANAGITPSISQTPPYGGLVADAGGNLFGMAADTFNSIPHPAVFEISNSGFVACFATGTRIRTTRGDIPVEDLTVDDKVLTMFADGEAPIIWIGHRRVDCRRLPRPEKVWPVCVQVGAFGDNMPRRDLWLSPDHAVFVEDVLIPIKHLINGTSIAQVPRNEVVYYHIELPHHDVLLAEGLPAESYFDTGDRDNFDNGGGPLALHPDFGVQMWEGYGCAPLIVTGPELQAVRQRLNSLAAATALHEPDTRGVCDAGSIYTSVHR